jgi:hypothetical protein
MTGGSDMKALENYMGMWSPPAVNSQTSKRGRFFNGDPSLHRKGDSLVTGSYCGCFIQFPQTLLFSAVTGGEVISSNGCQGCSGVERYVLG